MELVSPIIYKKLDFSKFDKTGTTKTNYTVFYDKFSKNIIQFGEFNIKIFNKKATNLKKNINLKLSKDKISYVAVDKQMRYMNVLIEDKMLIVNLRTEKVCEILHYHFTTLLGMFYPNQHTGGAYSHDDIVFTLVLVDKLVYFKICQNTNSEKVSEMKVLKFGSNSLLTNFYFNLRYSVLILEKKDKNFEFFNLSNEKFYSKAHNFVLPSKKKENAEGRNSISRFFGMFKSSAIKKNQENPLLDGYQQKEQLYKKTQFFLETIYKKLYFISLNYDSAEIQIYHVESLISLKKVKTIIFENTQISTLQFIDNMILLHNFERCDTVVLDLKSENNDKIIFKNFPMTNSEILLQNKDMSSEILRPVVIYDSDGNVNFKINYNYVETVSMLSYHNRCFYEKNLIVHGSIILDKDTSQHYVIYFDPMIYYENIPVKYEAVFTLIRRKDAKDVIIHALYEMIKSNYSIKILKITFNKIVKQLQKNLYNTKHILGAGSSRSLITSNEMEEKQKNSYELLNPKHYVLLRKKTIIKQPDLYYSLFKPFEYKSNVNLKYIFKLLVHFVNSLSSSGIPIQPSFQSILVNFLRKINNFSFVGIFLQYHSIPDSLELAKFLIEECQTDNTSAFQLGIDMLIRMKKYEEAFMTLINKSMLLEGLLFMKRYKVNIEYISAESATQLKNLVEENKQMVINFLESY